MTFSYSVSTLASPGFALHSGGKPTGGREALEEPGVCFRKLLDINNLKKHRVTSVFLRPERWVKTLQLEPLETGSCTSVECLRQRSTASVFPVFGVLGIRRLRFLVRVWTKLFPLPRKDKTGRESLHLWWLTIKEECQHRAHHGGHQQEKENRYKNT